LISGDRLGGCQDAIFKHIQKNECRDFIVEANPACRPAVQKRRGKPDAACALLYSIKCKRNFKAILQTGEGHDQQASRT
jgi:hypothetical protein